MISLVLAAWLPSGVAKMLRTFLQQGPKMRERPKCFIGFFISVYCGESSSKFQMYNEQKANGTLTRENQNANNKSAEII